jgi:TatD DNase family protein
MSRQLGLTLRALDRQREVFERILRLCALAGDKILTVHSVRSASHVLAMIEAPISRGRVVLHWFTGTRSECRRAVDLGCYFSINGEMLRSARHQALIADLPLDRLLTETDGPFVRIHNRAVQPSDVAKTLTSLA